MTPDYTPTPDRRYFVVKGRLWRLTNPSLDAKLHEQLVAVLIESRRIVLGAADSGERVAARLRADAAKKALGERGEVWWKDGAPDYNRRLAADTPYASWFHSGQAGSLSRRRTAVAKRSGKDLATGR